MNLLTLLEAASFRPERLVFPNSWIGHIPFAAWLIKSIHPSIFVELGTHSGNSYLAFCQAAKEASLSASCYAIDTWKGDDQAGFYGEEIYSDLNAYHTQHYAEFSRLMRMTFDEGVTYFGDGSIGLLHIDGLHTYEAVRHDFETWLPKLAKDAIVIFHDTNVHEPGFGVWRYWSELCQQYPLNMEFLHSNGLGVLAVSNNLEPGISELFHMGTEELRVVREYFSALGQKLLETYSFQEQINQINEHSYECEQVVQTLKVQVEEREQVVQTLKVQVEKRDQTVQTLKAQVEEREQTVQTLAEGNRRLTTSNSWRITAPLRKIKEIFWGAKHS